ncbi:peptide ABC transporter substrate-binding protein [Viridibacillus sp. FSL R5-0477]|uniref:Dipeptide ABC transporter (Dipeptide-binding protein) n=1 Tax=Viridibacillus arenosi FSL R5-213 TaxID=1227360 RepID=W4EQN5_9BACL|nr:peptide ABC transporter substrate-binding protein [Viridibacillus arenosi]ETT82121.1 Dipeptide ABC transporter (Dipeptide-binding protein) [Viridibacillus arenosi FSL R5-213]OMC90357.1 oligopeptide ABC transporter substrate-binding protein [Viridibacillus arenosi]
MKKWLTVLFVAVFAIVLSACTANKEAGKEPSSTEGGGDAKEKVLYLNNGSEPTSFDPSVGFNAVSWNALNNLMEGLVRFNDKDQPVEATAEKIAVSDDGLTYTFTIRDGAKWSNGDAVTAGDFVFGWLHMLDPETASPAAFLAYPIDGAEAYNTGKGKAEEVAIKATDDKTFEVKLNAPTDAFLSIITNPSFFPVNEKVAKENPKWFAEADSFVGNGPFNLSEWEHDVKFVFKKNDHYWDKDTVKLDKVDWAMVNDTNTEYQMYKSDELDVSSVPAELAEQLKNDKELHVEDQAGIYFYRFNVEKKPFTNKKIRQAFAKAVDQENIVQYVTKNGEKAAHGFVTYGFTGPDGKEFRESVGDLVSLDKEEAKKLLQEGMKEEGWSKLPKVTLTYSTSPEHQNIAVALQSQIKDALGVDAKLQNVEASVFLAEQKELKHQTSRSSFLYDYADPINAIESFITDSPMNRTAWSNKKFDSLIKSAKQETDATKRWETLQEAERVLIDEAPIVPLYFYNQVSLEKSNVSGIVRHPVGYTELKWADKN